MLKGIKTSLYLCVLLISFASISQETNIAAVKVLSSNANQQDSVDYFKLVLIHALNVTEKDYGPYQLENVDLPYSQERSLSFLDDPNGLDVMHTMTNQSREERYIAIKVPLLKGLMGHRRLLTNVSNVGRLNSVKNLDELRSYIACQGTHWPDSDILEYNEMIVARVLKFEAMFDMVSRGRCDYFPRAIQEITPEFEAFRKDHPNLAIVPDVMLQYRSPTYFFVGKRNLALAQRLSEGLSTLAESGQLDELIKQSPIGKGVFPLSQWQNTRIIRLDTPTALGTENPNYWFDVGQ